jgi:hypothetical protein
MTVMRTATTGAEANAHYATARAGLRQAGSIAFHGRAADHGARRNCGVTLRYQ